MTVFCAFVQICCATRCNSAFTIRFKTKEWTVLIQTSGSVLTAIHNHGTVHRSEAHLYGSGFIHSLDCLVLYPSLCREPKECRCRLWPAGRSAQRNDTHVPSTTQQ